MKFNYMNYLNYSQKLAALLILLKMDVSCAIQCVTN